MTVLICTEMLIDGQKSGKINKKAWKRKQSLSALRNKHAIFLKILQAVEDAVRDGLDVAKLLHLESSKVIAAQVGADLHEKAPRVRKRRLGICRSVS